MKNIIVALDGLDKDTALNISEEIKDYIWGVKFNDLLDRYGIDIISEFRKRGVKVFADPKLKDIPNTVKNRIKHYENAGANFVTVFIDGGHHMLEVARDGAVKCSVLGVTVLTSISQRECLHIYNDVVDRTVDMFARMALEGNLDGVVCSPKEISIIDKHFDAEGGLIKVVPGIRPSWYGRKDDQQRFTTPKEAMEAGADFLVIGRPILQANDRVEAAKLIFEEIKSVPKDKQSFYRQIVL